MIQKFNDLPWHDAELKKIIIEREQKDSIRVLVRWPDYFGAHCTFIDFIGCYAFQGDMLFGIVPPDFILEARCSDESEELNNMAIGLKPCSTTEIWLIFSVEESVVEDKVHGLKLIALARRAKM